MKKREKINKFLNNIAKKVVFMTFLPQVAVRLSRINY